MNTDHKDPDTRAPLTQVQFEAKQRDCAARLTAVASELTALLKRAAQLDLDRRAVVIPVDEERQVHDLRPLPEKVVYRFPRRVPGPRYQIVVVLPPETEVIYPDDVRHPEHPDHKD